MDPTQTPDPSQATAPPADPQQAAPAQAAPPTQPMVAMIDPKGQAVNVAADRAFAAQAFGYKNAFKMQGPDGSQNYVAQDRVDAARQANYAVSPDNPNVQKMVTPDGRITYALPDEVQKFQASGHTKIAPDGRFEVQPLPGEESTDTMQRAANVAKALGPEGMEQSLKAERNWWVSKEGLKDEAAGAANVGLAGAETLATIAGVSGTAQAAKLGLTALGETETMQLIKSSPRLYAEWVLKHPQTRQAIIKGAVKVGGGAASAIGAGAVYQAYKWLSKLD